MLGLFWLFLVGRAPCAAGEYLSSATGGVHYRPHQFAGVGDDGLYRSASCRPLPAACATSPTCACLDAADILGRCTEDHGALSVSILAP